ncbi:SMP-30/gluconolactonase/LRE family protein [Pseudomonas typographi]|uniref:Glyoxalase n=1 Tax=Pseudomonas typographi TaxID=2715964 RepID=A0ABR7Z9J6_9PSED|nr:L-dopachrome tautomerase-related protein [Pseudomonas typographi]MBD1551102.1 glyoxalase [Pseudomonas typographi]MBD1586404.1 glyoxalase [Pseudomonas typographi]MBD1602221.1 glyoxalase [Pseudomonas typographi]
MLNRRHFCRAAAIGGGTLALAGGPMAKAQALFQAGQPLTEVASLDWLCNAVALTSSGRLFVGLPRWPGFENTPSIAEVLPDGTLKPFPGGHWNNWAPGKPSAQALVKINTIHIFDDDTLWAIDQGEDAGPNGINPAQKILQFDTRTGKLLRSITLAPSVLPAGANLNDLRLDGEHAYVTDSGLGAIIVINLRTGTSLRRLADHPSTKMIPTRRPIGEGGHVLLMPDGSDHQVHSDPIEISPDGKWLYYQALTGPLWRVPTAALRDTQVTEKALGDRVEFVYDTGALTGTAIDSAGNLYLAEYDKPRVTVLSPQGELRVVVEDPRLWNPDAMFISDQRELYIPVPQSARMASNRGPGGVNGLQLPFKLYKVQLPPTLGGREKVPALAGAPLVGAAG